MKPPVTARRMTSLLAVQYARQKAQELFPRKSIREVLQIIESSGIQNPYYSTIYQTLKPYYRGNFNKTR
jgi:hypothetical protein